MVIVDWEFGKSFMNFYENKVWLLNYKRLTQIEMLMI